MVSVALKELLGLSNDSDTDGGNKVLVHGDLELEIVSAKGIKKADWLSKTDGYIKAMANHRALGQTKVILNSQTPQWNEKFQVAQMCDDISAIKFRLYDSDSLKNDRLGIARLDVHDLLQSNGQTKETTLKFDTKGSLTIRYKFTPAYTKTLPLDIAEAYFEAVDGNLCYPIQCAVCPPGCIPTIQTADGPFAPGQYWHDLLQKIDAARKFIYITGWSVWVDHRLNRTIGNQELKLGDLLKKKANEGVRVCVMVWNDLSSGTFTGNGMMLTHDEETTTFFNGSQVECANVARAPSDKGLFFTHHQKAVSLDSDGKCICYVGGIDLCDGRWDSPNHPLFRTLQGPHSEDYHQCMIQGTSVETGPREPWQDLHARLEGPICRDVVTNFEERWKRMVPKRAAALRSLDDVSFAPVRSGGPCGSWRCQFFRSIDSHIALLKPKFDVLWRAESGSKTIYDKSIQYAYVHHIRRARNFLFLENQYYLGSSHWWSKRSKYCTNLIPIEIAMKVAERIRARKNFHAFIVIPMWPEGLPDDGTIQEILKWQSNSVAAMYRVVAKALRDVGSRDSPRKYLTFHTLVNRETEQGSQCKAGSTPTPGTDGYEMWKNRRAPIYIHSKYMCVDDEWMIMGSANINQRSMDGCRDSEMCWSGYQQSQLCRGETSPKGVVQAFRLQLWAQYLGLKAAQELEQFRNPHDPAAVRAFQMIEERQWQQFLSDDITDMKGHLVPYPYEVSLDGTVTSRLKHFADCSKKATVCGMSDGKTATDIVTT
eukprot:CAMPEP_0178396592 /NCGR_PEP_ID=MMETSP0689_2-20121128/13807_1 /TAXON_ID=160604 /ORGANISM="Amphidinium massartii, Strain CS-259" /LENGTH=765 /DNA_ID=CAMNT_0020017269 /DNA_START=36 /DNA_END=2333 /DNA_ORIENTATION=+